MTTLPQWPGRPGYQPDYSVLQDLGFSPMAVACYRSLYEDGMATAGELAARLSKRSHNSLYEVLARLRAGHFIESYRYDGWTIHEYVPINQGLVLRHRDERRLLGEIITYQQLRAETADEYE